MVGMIRQLSVLFADEFHRLERALFQKGESRGSRVIQFTSSHRSEGVTAIILAFADYMAKLHGPQDVVVIETNFRNPSFGRIFSIASDHSLSHLLRREDSLEEALIEPADYGFSVIVAGRPEEDRNTPSIEASLEGLGEILMELRKSYKYILLDTPPIIPFIDAGIISSFTDGIVIVVESNLTRSEVLDDAIIRVQSGGAPILGIILNKREFQIPRWLYRLL
jgi:Mrp family chromosome partitioning ATPase